MARTDSAGRFCSRKCSGLWHTGRLNGNYRGGLSRMSNGRKVIICRDGSLMYFYRAVAAAQLGRELRDDEVVHHIDGDVRNDDAANLAVMAPRDHVRLHHRQGDLDTSGLKADWSA